MIKNVNLPGKVISHKENVCFQIMKVNNIRKKKAKKIYFYIPNTSTLFKKKMSVFV